MINLSSAKLAAAAGGFALALTAGAGVASAAPDLVPIVNSTCSYAQVMSALNAQDSAAAAQFKATPGMDSGLQQFLAAPPAQRQQMAAMIAAQPAYAPFFGTIQQVFNTCNNY